MGEQFIHLLDDMKTRSDWGLELNRRLNLKTLSDSDFAADSVENLVAGFSNRCNLHCAFCGVHQSKKLDIPLHEFEVARLIELIQNHKTTTGEKIGHFRIGNTGEPLINKGFIELVERTDDAVSYYSLISNLNIKNEERVNFVAQNPKFKWINVSCDAGDPATYRKMRGGGDFELVKKNIHLLRNAGKRTVLNAVVFKENEASLLLLPQFLQDEGFSEIHVFYPLNPNPYLHNHGLHKLNLEQFKAFLSKMRSACEPRGIRVSSDAWVYRPEMIGVLPEIDTEEMYRTYATSACDALYHLILYPEGSYNNCSVLSRLGRPKGLEKTPIDTTDILQMLNTPEVLTFRKLQMMGHFAPPCKLICGKIDQPRTEPEAALILRMKYPDRNRYMDLPAFEHHMKSIDDTFAIRALSPALRNVLEVYPDLTHQVDLIIDRDRELEYHEIEVMTPEEFPPTDDTGERILLIGSDRHVVFNSVIKQAERFSEIYKLVVDGSNPRDYGVQQLFP